MSRRSKIWLAIAGSFTLVNVAWAVYAAALGEGLHAGVHVVLTVLGVYWMRRVLAGARGGGVATVGTAGRAELSARMANLERSLDAVALDVERIGEGQRFMTNVLAERQAKAAGAGAEHAPAVRPSGREQERGPAT